MLKNNKYDIALPLHGVAPVPVAAKDAAIIKLEYLNSENDMDAVAKGTKQAKTICLSLSAAQIDELVRILGNAAAEIRDDK